jgi:hypothetical protein
MVHVKGVAKGDKVCKKLWLRFQVLTVASMKMTAFWDIMPCSLIEVSMIRVMMDAVHTSETSDYINATTMRYIPDSCHLKKMTI